LWAFIIISNHTDRITEEEEEVRADNELKETPNEKFQMWERNKPRDSLHQLALPRFIPKKFTPR
jgi:hypothetical protein